MPQLLSVFLTTPQPNIAGHLCLQDPPLNYLPLPKINQRLSSCLALHTKQFARYHCQAKKRKEKKSCPCAERPLSARRWYSFKLYAKAFREAVPLFSTMPEYPYSDDMYSALDDSNVEEEPDELYNVAAGLGLGDSSYRPGGPPQQQSDEEVALSPSDGYFGRSDPPSGGLSTTAYPSDSASTALNSQRQQHPEQVPFNRSTSASVPRSSQVPHVPNIWVSDPSLEQGSIDKAREAQEERDQYQNRHLYNTTAYQQHRADRNLGSSSLSSPAAAGASSTTFPLHNSRFPAATGRPTAASPSSSSSVVAAHRYTPSHSSFSAAGRPHYPQRIYSERSSLFGDAPPAYTPSPTSPTSNTTSSGTPHHNNYQTFSPTSPIAPGTSSNNMGRLSESESHGLLAGQTYNAIPQSMSGELDPNDDGHFEYPRPIGWKDRVRHFNWRKNWKLVLLGVVLTIITLALLIRSVQGPKEEVSSTHGPPIVVANTSP